MNKLQISLIAPLVVASLGAAVLTAQPVSATSSNTCTVLATGTKNTAGKPDSRFVLNSNGTVSATFEVKGADNCKMDVTLVSWEAPNATDGRPYSEQKLFAHVTGTFGKGKHTLTVKMPKDNCFYQIDLVRGKNPTGPNGSPIYEEGRMMGSLHGGVKKCEDTPKTPELPKDVPKVESATTVTELPKTGPGETVAVTTVLVAALAAGVQYIRAYRTRTES